MKKIVFAAALLLAGTSLASAANVTFTFGNKTKTFVISAANANRLAAWAAAAYPTIPNPACNPVCPEGQSATIANPEPVISAIEGLFAGIKANVVSFEREKAKSQIADPAAID